MCVRVETDRGGGGGGGGQRKTNTMKLKSKFRNIKIFKFECIFFNENAFIAIDISLRFVCNGLIKASLVQITD